MIRSLQLAVIALAIAAAGVFTSTAEAKNPKRSEAYFMTRAERAAKIVCSKQRTPKKVSNCRNQQLAAARRIVRYIRRGNKERRLKKTLGCLQKVQVLPARLRRRGMLWVERCAK
ncbi:MAG: hypothetical protein AAF441_03285 [Pseudomonadota bacterium]